MIAGVFFGFFAGAATLLYRQAKITRFTNQFERRQEVNQTYSGLEETIYIGSGESRVCSITEPLESINVHDCAVLVIISGDRHGMYHVNTGSKPREIRNWLDENFPSSAESNCNAYLLQGSLFAEQNQKMKYFLENTNLKKVYDVLEQRGLAGRARYIIQAPKENRDGERRSLKGSGVVSYRGKMFLPSH